MIVTDSTFEDVIKDNTLILIDFWAPWCGPCTKVSPLLDEISEEHGILVGKLNVDENILKSTEYAVHSIPTMVLFEDGFPVKTITGAMPKHKLLKELDQWI